MYYIPIVQLSVNGEYIADFKNAVEAENKMGIQGTNIRNCCKGKRTSAGNFKWMYKLDYEELIKANEIAI